LGLPVVPPAPLAGALPAAPGLAVGDTGLPGRGAALPTEGEMGRMVGECDVRGRGLGAAAVDLGDDGGGWVLVVAPPAGTSILFPIPSFGSSCSVVVWKRNVEQSQCKPGIDCWGFGSALCVCMWTLFAAPDPHARQTPSFMPPRSHAHSPPAGSIGGSRGWEKGVSGPGRLFGCWRAWRRASHCGRDEQVDWLDR